MVGKRGLSIPESIPENSRQSGLKREYKVSTIQTWLLKAYCKEQIRMT